MAEGNEVARNLLTQEPGRENRHATAASNPNVARRTAQRHNGGGLHHVTLDNGEPFTIAAKGREAWVLDRLLIAGPTGCTPIDEPAPRWSAYVHRLREMGAHIETLHEKHDGPYPGTHGRYVLRCAVQKGGAV